MLDLALGFLALPIVAIWAYVLMAIFFGIFLAPYLIWCFAYERVTGKRIGRPKPPEPRRPEDRIPPS